MLMLNEGNEKVLTCLYVNEAMLMADNKQNLESFDRI